MKQEEEGCLLPNLFKCEELEMYDCQHCNFTTELSLVLKKHIRDYHSKKSSLNLNYTYAVQSYICRRCTFETHFSLNWLKHEVNNCCGNLTQHKNLTVDHINDNNGDNLKEDQFPTNSESLNLGGFFFCELCSYETKWHRNLMKHVKAKHQTPEDQNLHWFVCKQCNYITRNEVDLKQHLRRNHTAFKCSECPYETHLKTVLERHTLLMHLPMNVVWLKCGLCDFQTKFKNSLNMHMLNKHTPEENIKWFECDICPYRSKLKQGLKMHKLRKHTRSENVNFYRCKLCPYKSKEMTHLKSHELTHIEAFKCDQCSFVTKRKHTLTRHKRLKHLQEDDVPLQKCKLCPFVTKFKRNLKSHEFLVHSDERLKCDQCDFTSKWKVEIKCHKIRKHLRDDEIQWYHCHICSYKGKFQSYLTTHVACVHQKGKRGRNGEVEVGSNKIIDGVADSTHIHRTC